MTPLSKDTRQLIKHTLQFVDFLEQLAPHELYGSASYFLDTTDDERLLVAQAQRCGRITPEEFDYYETPNGLTGWGSGEDC